ncbi:MAG TPA: hypothetical protein VEW25_09430 [Allosphingosinicella sp.]|nr:hypothetical protein [Allosphingosinicella sp.]
MTTPARRGFLASLRRGLAAIDVAFCKLNRIQYDAPWRSGETRRC